MATIIPRKLPSSIRSHDGERKANIRRVQGAKGYYVDLFSLDRAGNPQLSSLSPSKPLGKERAFQIASDWVAGG